MADTATRSALRGLHLQVMGAQASLAAIDHTLREMLGTEVTEAAEGTEPERPKTAIGASELRSLLGKPTLEEQRSTVFMGRQKIVTQPPSDETVASGTPNGTTPSVPSD